ncbi:MAG: DNA alkylation repair protein [Nanoarchaeota archaeon]
MLKQLRKELDGLKNPEKAKILARFFKTGKGEYGEGDVFLGLMVPESRKVAIKYKELQFGDIKDLLNSKIHEERLISLLILVHNYKNGNNAQKEKIFDFYLKNAKKVNNWDLVDLTADKIIGAHLIGKDTSILFKLAKSDNLWERRIAIISTFYFIRNNMFDDTFKISEILMNEKHDLIQKAVGWMLREVGKKNQEEEEKFLLKHYKKMPRTMLRYAIEKFDEDKRKIYLGK